MISEEQLQEWMDEYNVGYEKAYKCIPDLIDEVRAQRQQLAEKSLGHSARLEELKLLRKLSDLAIAYHDACEEYEKAAELDCQLEVIASEKMEDAWQAFDAAVRQVRGEGEDRK